MEAGSRPPRLRYSIWQLGVLVLLMALGIALVMQDRELTALRRELRAVRNEAGFPAVDDPRKFYSVKLLKYEGNIWS